MLRQVFDIETLAELFTCSFRDYDSDQKWMFVISKTRNDLPQLKEHLKKVRYLIGFNSIDFDSPILNWMITQNDITPEKIYKVAQITINKDNKWDDYTPYRKYKYNSTWVNIDLFLYWSKMLRISKKLSLKYFAVNLNMNVQEMPIHHTRKNLTIDEELQVIEYNENDTLVTKYLALKLKEDINLRASIRKDYGLDAISWDAPKIASELLLDDYCKQTYSSHLEYLQFWEYKKEVRNTRFERKDFKNGDYLSIVNFKTKVFQDLYLRICNSSNGFNEELLFKRFDGTYLKLVFGSGGIHTSNKNEVYKTTETEEVISSDVASLYPTLIENLKAIRKELLLVMNIYSSKKQERIKVKAILNKAKEDKNEEVIKKYKSIDTLLKLILNAFSGLLDNEHSWAYSPPEIMTLRIMGQLILTRLAEECNSKKFLVVSQNTDGQEVIVPKNRKEEYFEIVKLIEEEFSLKFEHEIYKAIYYKSVNDYIAIPLKGKPKVKGEFIYEKVLDGSNEFLVIPLAVKEYFENNIPIKTTIENHKDIYNFCTAKKIAKNYKITMGDIEQQQLNRFFVSRKGGYLYKSKFRNLTKEEQEFEQIDEEELAEDKKTKIGTKLHVMKGIRLVLLNNTTTLTPQELEVDFNYYINKANTIVRLFENPQLSLI